MKNNGMVIDNKECIIVPMSYEALKVANQQLETVAIKGKDYVTVSERVKAFRHICPSGSIETEMVYYEGGRVIFKATVRSGETILATGYSEEKEGSTMINKTSFVENCETSAVGRALGFAGIGIDGSMASAEEVATAIINQNAPKTAPAKPQYPPEFVNACKFAAGGSTLGKLYKENRRLFDSILNETGTPAEMKQAQIIVKYMEGGTV